MGSEMCIRDRGISALLCESRRSGMTCTVGEHGFTLNDSAYDVW